jgi:dolichol-phosphate hexosyltransferase
MRDEGNFRLPARRDDSDPDHVVIDLTAPEPVDARHVKLSVVMPAHNEEKFIAAAIHRLFAVEMPCPIELIVVNDGSTDSTSQILASLDDPRLRVITHKVNQGKGAAVLTGAEAATGTHLLVFDADLEYSPKDIPGLLHPIIEGRCDVVYGTRLFGQNTVYQSFKYAYGNKVMTFATNVLFDANISDLHTCLKLIPLRLFRQLTLTQTCFGLDTEITAELLRRGVRPFEVPISYVSRSKAEGKKIDWKDAVRCFKVLGKVRMRKTAAGEVTPFRAHATMLERHQTYMLEIEVNKKSVENLA